MCLSLSGVVRCGDLVRKDLHRIFVADSITGQLGRIEEGRTRSLRNNCERPVLNSGSRVPFLFLVAEKGERGAGGLRGKMNFPRE